MADIYYVEDDRDIARGVAEYFRSRGLTTELFAGIGEARAALLRGLPRLLIIDRNLPGGSGDALCCWCRERLDSRLPILYLTVRGGTEDMVSGFAHGADDYVVKPFAPQVLHARVLALLRRAEAPQGPVLSCGGVTLDSRGCRVCVNGAEVALSQPEYRLLRILMENKGRTVTRQRLLEMVWDSDGSYVNDNTLTVAIKRLREKLGGDAAIRTVRSFGYRMEEAL